MSEKAHVICDMEVNRLKASIAQLTQANAALVDEKMALTHEILRSNRNHEKEYNALAENLDKAESALAESRERCGKLETGLRQIAEIAKPRAFTMSRAAISGPVEICYCTADHRQIHELCAALSASVQTGDGK